jgi:tetratricopeptide (TPR) repeat protein
VYRFMKNIFCLLLFFLPAFLYGQYKRGMEQSIVDTSLLKKAKEEIPGIIKNSDLNKLAFTYKAIANYYYEHSNVDSNLVYYRKALEEYKKLSDSFNIYYCYFRFGERSFYEGNSYDAALTWHLPAARYYATAKEYGMAAHSHYAVSTTYKKLDQPEMADQYMQKAIMYSKLGKDTVMEIIMLANLCDEWISNKPAEGGGQLLIYN